MTASTLYRWPAAAKFGRVIPKAKFYEHATVSAKNRERFVADVQRITWAFKLADATIHLRGSVDVPEVQVFAIDAKEDDVNDDVLATIDKAVQFPIIFEINQGPRDQTSTRMVAAYKQLGGAKPLISTYFSTGWQGTDAPRAPLPPALDLRSLYDQLLVPMLPLAARPGEGLPEVIGRVDQASKLERAIGALKRRLRIEAQFNRKVELRRQIRERTAALKVLTVSATSKGDDALEKEAPWTS